VGQGSTFHFTARFGSGPHAENGSAWPAASVAGTESGDDASSPTPTDIIFDRNAVLEQLGDDHALLAEIAGLFLVDLPGWLDQIQQAIRATDTDALLNTAHTLKGALGGLYAQAGMSAAFELEQAGKAAEPTAIHSAYQRLEKALDQLVPLLSALTPHGNPAEGSSDATP
jgi:HPt (histidine-containing phosphotransfer) domain-containing protein